MPPVEKCIRLIGALLLLLAAACSESPEKAARATVARVNGTAITKAQLDRTVDQMLAQKREVQLTPEQKLKTSTAALQELEGAELLYQEALKKDPIPGLDRQVEDAFDKNRRRFPSEEAFRRELERYRMTVAEMKDAMRREIVVSSYIAKEFTPKVSVSDAEAREFYRKNAGVMFARKEQVKASHILVAVDPKASAADKKKARQKAEALLKRVRSGEDFALVAQEQSDCPSASRGGELGEFPERGMMPPAFEKTVFSLKPGEISGIVETQFGFHVIKLLRKVPPHVEKYEVVKDKIVAFLTRDKVTKVVEAHMADLRARAKIEKL